MDNITAFSELLNKQIHRVSNAGRERVLEFGTIGDDLSLAADSLKDTIPKGDYLLAMRLTASAKPSEPLRGIRRGDRVLVAWVGGQPVVTEIVTGSKDLTLDGRK